MKIAIMSDSHENWDNLNKAIDIANKSDCELLLFAGDLIAPPGVAVLNEFKGKIKFVWGNNEGEKVKLTKMMDSSDKIELCEETYEGEIDNIKIFMNHYPRLGELAAKSGDYDLIIHGHTHEYREEKFASTILVNPGAIQGYKTPASFVIFNTSDKSIKKIAL